ncbi:MAG: hypothetical protein P1U74_10470 [Legionellaceae bacterium]|nr:hypothetical protein [Legionellaceae bacterium]
MKYIFSVLTLLFTLAFNSVYALEPWFTDPIIADHADIVPLGHEQLDLYLSDTTNYGIYDEHHSFTPTPNYYSRDLQPQYIFGLTKNIDCEVDLDFVRNENDGKSSTGIGDTVIMLGYQLSTQKNNKNKSDIRILFSTIFPTGRFDKLLPGTHTADATGAGSYQPSIGLLFQHLFALKNGHYLKAFAETNIRYASDVTIEGLSAYGGTIHTQGKMRPGNSMDLDLAAEYNLTQNWALAFETFVYAQQPSAFKGRITPDVERFIQRLNGLRRRIGNRTSIIRNEYMPTNHNIGNGSFIGSGSVFMFTILPAIEYNISANFGFIGGVWLSIGGKNTPAFYSPTIGFSKKWG